MPHCCTWADDIQKKALLAQIHGLKWYSSICNQPINLKWRGVLKDCAMFVEKVRQAGLLLWHRLKDFLYSQRTFPIQRHFLCADQWPWLWQDKKGNGSKCDIIVTQWHVVWKHAPDFLFSKTCLQTFNQSKSRSCLVWPLSKRSSGRWSSTHKLFGKCTKNEKHNWREIMQLKDNKMLLKYLFSYICVNMIRQFLIRWCLYDQMPHKKPKHTRNSDYYRRGRGMFNSKKKNRYQDDLGDDYLGRKGMLNSKKIQILKWCKWWLPGRWRGMLAPDAENADLVGPANGKACSTGSQKFFHIDYRFECL